ncbi:unnamed protein product [Amoebophrya sp. A120]|nr:unnamed protein product [Amoebophrya sp. A120]|eukprot:GSA120T00008468001.1
MEESPASLVLVPGCSSTTASKSSSFTCSERQQHPRQQGEEVEKCNQPYVLLGGRRPKGEHQEDHDSSCPTSLENAGRGACVIEVERETTTELLHQALVQTPLPTPPSLATGEAARNRTTAVVVHLDEDHAGAARAATSTSAPAMHENATTSLHATATGPSAPTAPPSCGADELPPSTIPPPPPTFVDVLFYVLPFLTQQTTNTLKQTGAAVYQRLSEEDCQPLLSHYIHNVTSKGPGHWGLGESVLESWRIVLQQQKNGKIWQIKNLRSVRLEAKNPFQAANVGCFLKCFVECCKTELDGKLPAFLREFKVVIPVRYLHAWEKMRPPWIITFEDYFFLEDKIAELSERANLEQARLLQIDVRDLPPTHHLGLHYTSDCRNERYGAVDSLEDCDCHVRGAADSPFAGNCFAISFCLQSLVENPPHNSDEDGKQKYFASLCFLQPMK